LGQPPSTWLTALFAYSTATVFTCGRSRVEAGARRAGRRQVRAPGARLVLGELRDGLRCRGDGVAHEVLARVLLIWPDVGQHLRRPRTAGPSRAGEARPRGPACNRTRPGARSCCQGPRSSRQGASAPRRPHRQTGGTCQTPCAAGRTGGRSASGRRRGLRLCMHRKATRQAGNRYPAAPPCLSNPPPRRPGAQAPRQHGG